VLRLLARAFDVTALCCYRRTPLSFSRPEGRTMEQDLAQRLAALAQLADVETFPIPQEYSVWRLAMGKAVVSTAVGCEGLAAEDGRNILIRDDPEAFAQAVRAVLQHGALRRRLGIEGRRTVERHYNWEGIGESMLPLYRSLYEATDEGLHRRPVAARST